MTTRKATADERDRAAEMIRRHAPHGATLYCVLRSVAKSGMSRRIDLYAIAPAQHPWPARPVWLSGHVATLLGTNDPNDPDRPRGIRVDGCGMDVGAHLVEQVARAVHGDDRAYRSDWM